MTRITNLVARKRKYSPDAPSASQEGDKTSLWPSSSTQTSGQGSHKHGKPKSSYANSSGRGLRGPKDRAAASEARRVARIDERSSDKTCFACRERGHAARDCPNAVNVDEGKSAVGICYRCGSNRHSLSRCKKAENPANPLPFASCFVCSRKGHLSGKCPENMNGLYPNGGGCKLCGLNDHLVKDCPTRLPTNTPVSSSVLGIVAPDAGDAGADEDDFHALRRRTHQVVREERAQERAEKLTRRVAPGPSSSGPSVPFVSRNALSVAPKRAKVVTF